VRKRLAAFAIAAAAVLAGRAAPGRANGLHIKYSAKTRAADQPSVVNVWTIQESSAAFVLLEGAATVKRARKVVDAVERQFVDGIDGHGACANLKTRGDTLTCAWEHASERAGLSFVGAVAYDDLVYFSQEGDLDVLLVHDGYVRKLHGRGVVTVKPGDAILLASLAVVRLGNPAIVSMLDPSSSLEMAVELLTASPPASATVDATAMLLRFFPPRN
jgi:hypothetical protein